MPDFPFTLTDFTASAVPENPHDDSAWHETMRGRVGNRADDLSVVLRLFSLGAVHTFWRNGPVESELHGGPWPKNTRQTRLHDGDMMRLNSWLCREVETEARDWTEKHGISDVPGLLATAKDDRMKLAWRVEGAIVLEEADLAGYQTIGCEHIKKRDRSLKRELIPVYVVSRAKRVAQHARTVGMRALSGAGMFFAGLAIDGATTAWWGTPEWERDVAAFLRMHPEYEAYRKPLLTEPWAIDSDTCDELTGRGIRGAAFHEKSITRGK